MCFDFANGFNREDYPRVRGNSLPLYCHCVLNACVLTFAADPTAGHAPASPTDGANQETASFRILVFSKTLGYRHANIPLGVEAIRDLGRRNGFLVDAIEESSVFTEENMSRYKVVVFLSVTGNVLNEAQEKTFQEFVLSGGGFVGIHGALFGPSACEENWAWYHQLCAVTFKNHSAVVPARVDIEDSSNPSTTGLPTYWWRKDEWYNYEGTPRGTTHVLATVDESTYKGGTVGGDHPIAWCKSMGKGIMWYTAMGHTEESFREEHFLQHILGGIQLAARAESADLTANKRVGAPSGK
jgi:type 1 glutamine amidotransferase